jgi:N-acetyl-anhydromuramyl-L-alanine amidase AmpD
MAVEDKLVAVISPWDKLPQLVKQKFWVESLPAEKKVAVWREDLQDRAALSAELQKHGVRDAELRTAKVTTSWKHVE